MKANKEILRRLQNIKYDLFDNYRTDFKERFEIVGSFMQDDLEDVISALDECIDRIEELEKENEELQDKVDELERDAA